MQWALVDKNGTIQSLIVYDGVSPYKPWPWLTLQQVEDWITLGENMSDPQPESAPEPMPESMPI
jgi:hypothetical protein